MTFKDFMHENGYDLKTTFWDDFSIADRLGEKVFGIHIKEPSMNGRVIISISLN